MGWNKSTKIMTSPLNINNGGDIQQAVGYMSGDLGTCITEGDINKWAKYKPQRHANYGKMTASERALGQWGFSMNTTDSDSIVKTSYSDFFNQATVAKEGEWTYLRPRGVYSNVTERFRVFDFLNADNLSANGYWADAPAPYSFSFPTSASATPATYEANLTITRPTIDSSHSGLALSLSDFTGISGIGSDISDYYYSVIYKKEGSSDISHVKGNKTVSTLAAGGTCTITLNFAPGTYTGFVIAEPNNFEEGDKAIYLPGGFFTLTYTQIPVQVYLASTNGLSWPLGTPQLNGNTISMEGLDLRVTFQSGDMPTYGQPFVVKFQAKNGESTVGDEVVYDPRVNIPQSSSSPIDIIDIPDITLSSGATVTALQTRIETTGANVNGVVAVLLNAVRTDQL